MKKTELEDFLLDLRFFMGNLWYDEKIKQSIIDSYTELRNQGKSILESRDTVLLAIIYASSLIVQKLEKENQDLKQRLMISLN